jgi:hypothetical protein
MKVTVLDQEFLQKVEYLQELSENSFFLEWPSFVGLGSVIIYL